MIFGAIEAGGTKFVCAVSDENLSLIERISIPTTTPDETMKAVIQFFEGYPEIKAIGIGSFGPIDINPKSDTYGSITSTPKLAWANYAFLDVMKQHFDIPYAWTTDVNAAAFGEIKKGAAAGSSSCVYITVGTGIGAGIIIQDSIIQGYSHPEAGHIGVKRHPSDHFKGNCPYHADCLEGMASGPAIEKRFGLSASNLDSTHEAWEIEADYLAQALVAMTLIVSPEKIILGGGVMKQTQLFPLIRARFKTLLNDYVVTPNLEDYILPCALGDNAGLTGCLLLAIDAYNK